jgi:hypothetical protein
VLHHQQGISLTWTIEGRLIRGLKGYRKLEENGEESISLPTSVPTSASTSPAAATDGPPTSLPTITPSTPNNGVAIGFAFGSANTSASVSSTGGGSGSASGTSNSMGYSSSFVEISSGAQAMTNSSGLGTAQAYASVDGDDQSPSSDYSNMYNSSYEASISLIGDTINSINTTAVEDLPAVPFSEIFGGFGTFYGGANPYESTSDTPLSGENASDVGTSDTETKVEEESNAAETYVPFLEIFGGFGAFYGGANPDKSTSDTSMISGEDASDGGTSDTKTIVEEESDNATSSTVENTDVESIPDAHGYGYQSAHSDGGYYGSFGAGP